MSNAEIQGISAKCQDILCDAIANTKFRGCKILILLILILYAYLFIKRFPMLTTVWIRYVSTCM